MVIGVWFLVVVIAIASIGSIIYTWYLRGNKKWDSELCEYVTDKSHIYKTIGLSVLYIATAAILIFGLLFWLYGTESGGRAIKSFEANTQGGIERSVTIYDAIGNEIQYYEGKFDVEHIEDKVMFDDENGKRHIIYYTTGTVIVDEK